MIHKTAIIDTKAKISTSAIIGPYSIIGPNVEIGDQAIIQSHVNITGYTSIGKNNKIYSFASIGSDPQDIKYKGEETKLRIGDGNTIREYVTINPGTVQGGGITRVGNNNLIMISAHIAHDCIIGNNTVIANSAAIAGHAEVEDYVIIGGNCGVQQFTRIGKMAMIGGMTGVSRDVIPYGLSTGNRNYLNGVNVVGLRRKKVTNKEIIGLTEAYKEIFKTENLSENLNNLNGNFKENYLVKDVVDFINKDKKRPICTPFFK
ncbi:acyl-ACP--UDP-N-acetylglucosamine O-acyltransferase [Candidatus Pelagibacter sp.]|nr:acyl-ACP--UDP-N-acetylglucosamine O-acyltransferase [Candidatus Pelagibacter sp.]|tara:strand:- start:2445 stop:3227 length:783 start_codon:yes stop_codon:yes gene_type:complete